jgi:hypothetical protein
MHTFGGDLSPPHSVPTEPLLSEARCASRDALPCQLSAARHERLHNVRQPFAAPCRAFLWGAMAWGLHAAVTRVAIRGISRQERSCRRVRKMYSFHMQLLVCIDHISFILLRITIILPPFEQWCFLEPHSPAALSQPLLMTSRRSSASPTPPLTLRLWLRMTTSLRWQLVPSGHIPCLG